MNNENIAIKKDVKDTSYEDDRGNLVRQSETTVTYTADILRTDTPTENGRLYPRAVMEHAIAEYQKAIASGRAYGALNPRPEEPLYFKDVSHVVTGVELRGDVVRATVQTLQTPSGKALASLLAYSATGDGMSPVHLHTAGMGSLQDGRVGDDYIIRSFDFHPAPPKEPTT